MEERWDREREMFGLVSFASLCISVLLFTVPPPYSTFLRFSAFDALGVPSSVLGSPDVVPIGDRVLYQESPPPDRDRRGGGQSEPHSTDDFGASDDENSSGDDRVGLAPGRFQGPDVFR